jgi:DNA-binding NarL/FixJ family response regulator
MKTESIGGRLDLASLSALSGQRDDERMKHFTLLMRDQQQQAIQRLAVSGMSDHGIARATGLSVEMICRLLGDRQEQRA